MRGLFLPLLFCPTYLCVRFASLGVPGSVSRGDPVWLYCGYELEGDELYSVKWYKDNVEFYRFLPSDQPSAQMYSLDGVFLDLHLSNATHAFLYTSDLDTEGQYGCEVSTEVPSFRTIKAGKELRVHVIPNEAPRIYGVTRNYKIGDLVNMTCVFGPSKPLAQIVWHINGKEAPASMVFAVAPSAGPAPLVSESLLSLPLEPWISSVQCSAQLARLLATSSRELVFAAEGVKRILHVPPGQEVPVITGELERYNLGDEVDVKCSSVESVHHSDLQWSINEEQVPQEFLYRDESSSLGLRFLVSSEHWKSEEMRLKCTTTFKELVVRTSFPFTVHFSTASILSSSLHWLLLLVYLS